MTRDEAEALRPYAASALQIEALDAVAEHGSMTAAAKALGRDESAIRERVNRMKRAAAATDPKLHAKAAPLGYHLSGVSTLSRDEDGNLRWTKTREDWQRPESVLDAFRAAVADEPLPVREPVAAADIPRRSDVLAVYPMGDPHLGMLSWGEETGADFDTKIAEELLTGAVDRLVGLAPDCEQALIINLGDFFHADNMDARTMRSGNKLDVDSRWAKVLRVGFRAMCRCIDRALEKHSRVRVINEIGNHDDHSAIMLSICLDGYYANNQRVEIDTSPAAFHWYEFGKVLIGVTHGHNVKANDLPGVMAADMPEAWGRTKHRYFYCGHFHHERKVESAGCVVEYFRTLAPRDAWGASQRWRSGRSMVCDVLHQTHGRIMRHEVQAESILTAVANG